MALVEGGVAMVTRRSRIVMWVGDMDEEKAMRKVQKRQGMLQRAGRTAVTVGFALCLGATSVWAAVPTTLTAEGLLAATGGGPVADGNYALKFTLYKDAEGGSAVWAEGPVQVTVKGGAFSQALGSVQALSPAVTASAGFLAVQVGQDPELPRRPLRSAPFALRSAVAEGLDCSGCVTVGMLAADVLAGYAKSADLAEYAKAADLAGLAKTADLAAYAKLASLGAYAMTSKLADVATTGSYTDLSGLPVLAKLGTACGTGLVVKGLKADGSLECAAPIAGGKCDAGQVVTEVKSDGSVVCAAPTVSLPADGLAAVSNGLLTNVFDEVYASSTTPKNIPDNNPSGVLDEIIVPDSGTVKEISVSIDIVGQATGSLVVTLFDPNNDTYVLHSKKDVGTALKTTYPTLTKTVSGDLATWVGKNPKGTWRLVVADWAAGGAVGVLKGWSVNVKVLSTGRVESTTSLAAKNLTVKCLNGAAPAPVVKCTSASSNTSWTPATAGCPAGYSPVSGMCANAGNWGPAPVNGTGISCGGCNYSSCSAFVTCCKLEYGPCP